MADATTVKGAADGHDVMLYALSTCIWCKKTKKLLDTLGVTYRYYFVDQLTGADEDGVMAEVKRHNPQCTFPTLVIDGRHCIVGFKEPEIRKALA
ncbi:MAG: glutaredoxin family protein [Candidatus Edwardsbacteria bacterium]|jgi:glutaredoxin|nr:glutaredoxin family protein [Candidatus Edwardsbacteria bacterium]